MTSGVQSATTAEATDAPIAVRLTGITKRYPGVVANSDINLTVRRATVHALVGENGAGKSTLMKTLYGMHQPDEGTIEVDGRELVFHSPADAIAAGIGMVHQHFMLADNLTVWENIVLGSEPVKGGRLDAAGARRHISELATRYGLTVDPAALVETLGVGARQRVEILKVLYRGAKILILDEPTAVLVPQEVDELFGNLRDLKSEGLTIIFISHKLDEVRSISDEITVIRRGTTVGTADPKQVTNRQLAELMVGSALPVPELRESTVTDREVLRLTGVRVAGGDGRDVLTDIDLTIHAGEVVGIAGVEGNGQAELVDAIMGIIPLAGGTVALDGTDISALSTLHRREAGVGFIPEDRHRQGLLLEASLWENRMLGHQTRSPSAKGRFVNRAGARSDTQRIVDQYDVRTPGIDVLAAALSGGNQQKLIVGREMSGNPVLLIASHPTRGVDVGAQAAIWEHLRNARAAGLAVLLISADLEELIGMSDTLTVILRGRLVGTYDPHQVTPESLGGAMTGAGHEDVVAADPEGDLTPAAAPPPPAGLRKASSDDGPDSPVPAGGHHAAGDAHTDTATGPDGDAD
ncbi:ATP-binding cassette domain-containing protein [Nakamurella sp. YIM 132087]|uniref:ATP-binding cassette domain-containing protein n=1 Tax=Nakamurella alba TaxID=2665158 RepID=A0A7K1FJH5_9ACTN|nr:ABC transporter ATP-binding protein [Nakamurella alba]MTD14248.1 ATP-binding cassette domain-containing protein [Nakamurella alba]